LLSPFICHATSRRCLSVRDFKSGHNRAAQGSKRCMFLFDSVSPAFYSHDIRRIYPNLDGL
jgi:hypothetical protein